MIDFFTAHDWLLLTGLGVATLAWWLAFRIVR